MAGNTKRRREIPRKSPVDFMTVPEAGAQIGLGRVSSYQAVKRGEIPIVLIMGRMKVAADWLERRKDACRGRGRRQAPALRRATARCCGFVDPGDRVGGILFQSGMDESEGRSPTAD